MKNQSLTLLLSLALFCTEGYSQIAEPARFTDKVQGQWELTELNASGRIVDYAKYKPCVFSNDQWTIENSNGAHTYALASVTLDKELTEVTLIDTKVKRGFVAVMKLVGDELIIARRGTPIEEQDKIKRDDGILMMAKPESMEPGPNRLVYKFRRQQNTK